MSARDHFWSYQECKTDIASGLGIEGHRLRIRSIRWIDDLGQAGIAVDLVEDARGAVTHNQDGWQNQRRDVGDLALEDLNFQARPSCGPFIRARY